MSGLGEPREVRVPGRPGAFRVYDTHADAGAGPWEHTLVLLHGCGGTSQTFGAMAATLPKSVRVIAFDLRGHGGTHLDDDSMDTDLSLSNLVEDTRLLIEESLPDKSIGFVLCGHSLGGAIAARAAALFKDRCRGLIILDAVEGIATNSIESGIRAAESRPKRFRTVEDAIKYATSTSHHGHFSASISIPDQLVPHPQGGFTWRTDILSTSPYWREWFTGLSNDFLALKCSKLLILAGVENLDGPLSAGHMQGNYQLIVLANVRAGHFVQEDAPGQTATVILTFLNRVKVKEVSMRPGGLSAQEVIALNAKLRQSPSVLKPHQNGT